MVRFKNRYIAAQVETGKSPVDSQTEFTSAALYHSLINKVQQLHGDFGTAAIKVGFSAKYFNEPTKMAIIRVRHGPHRFILSSLPFVNEIDRHKVVINTLYVGATLLHCNKFLQKYQRRKLEQTWLQMKPGGRQKLEELVSALDVSKLSSKTRKNQ
ncbi:ribonuclease P/MRP protein subunit POP5 [Ischnura elegans]|uniref:ribonuclease P/MRP protein subunit POP5 n=1 Tax=Ischnura elegans TaxID=197161 RepID=UPI001ED895B2|nr:ribonuclease P/MRP protein subunit POP5 [Ischnura elegans]